MRKMNTQWSRGDKRVAKAESLPGMKGSPRLELFLLPRSAASDESVFGFSLCAQCELPDDVVLLGLLCTHPSSGVYAKPPPITMAKRAAWATQERKRIEDRAKLRRARRNKAKAPGIWCGFSDSRGDDDGGESSDDVSITVRWRKKWRQEAKKLQRREYLTPVSDVESLSVGRTAKNEAPQNRKRRYPFSSATSSFSSKSKR